MLPCHPVFELEAGRTAVKVTAVHKAHTNLYLAHG